MGKTIYLLSMGVAFILGAGAGWIAEGGYIDALFGKYVPAIVTILAAFYGAKFAFQFQNQKEELQERNRNIVSGNLVIFKLITMINNLHSYQRQVIDPVRGKESAFLEMNPTLPQEKEKISLNLDSLAFLLGTEDQNILGELSVEEAKYDAVICAINERSMVHRDEAQHALEASSLTRGGDYSREEVEKALGQRLFLALNSSTNQIIDHVDGAILSLNEVSNKLTFSLKKHFPGQRIISIRAPGNLKEEEDVQDYTKG